MTVKFRNPVQRTNLSKEVSDPGDNMRPIYKWRYDEDGKPVHKITEYEDVYEIIQAERDGTDLKRMLERYENGDESALSKVQGMYIDTVALPKNYAQLYEAVAIHNQVFDSMPVEIKEKYHNNPAEYWKAFGTVEFDETLNAYRQMIYEHYGQLDPEPVNTSGKFVQMDDEIPVEKPVETVEKVGDEIE